MEGQRGAAGTAVTADGGSAHMRTMPMPESFNRIAVIDATLKDILAGRLIDFDTLPEARKFDLRNSLMPVVNAMAPHIAAQLALKTPSGGEEPAAFVVPDSLEGLL